MRIKVAAFVTAIVAVTICSVAISSIETFNVEIKIEIEKKIDLPVAIDIDFAKLLAEFGEAQAPNIDSFKLYAIKGDAKENIPFRYEMRGPRKGRLAWTHIAGADYLLEFRVGKIVGLPLRTDIPLLMDGDAIRSRTPGGYSPFFTLYPSMFTDIDSDGDKELVAGSYHDFVYVLENVGSDSEIAFSENHYYLLHSGKIPIAIAAGSDHGWMYSAPAIADFDGNGGPDIILSGRSSGRVLFFQNEDKGKMENFRQQVIFLDPSDFGKSGNGGIGFTCAPIDWDSDGDVDILASMLSGGKMYLLENITLDGSQLPQFGKAVEVKREDGQPMFGKSSRTADIKSVKDSFYKVGEATPTFVDWDSDGDMDIFCGSISKIFYFENKGDSRTFQFAGPVECRAADGLFEANPRSGIYFFDYDNDGDLDVITAPPLRYWENFGDARDPKYGKSDPIKKRTLGTLIVGRHNTIDICDFDNDGKPDLGVGEHSGKIRALIQEDTLTYSQMTLTSQGKPLDFFGCPDPGENSIGYARSHFGDYDGDGDKDLITYSEYGWRYGYLHYYENPGQGTDFLPEKQVGVEDTSYLIFEKGKVGQALLIDEYIPFDYVSYDVEELISKDAGKIELYYKPNKPVDDGEKHYILYNQRFPGNERFAFDLPDPAIEAMITAEGPFRFSFLGDVVEVKQMTLEPGNWYKLAFNWDKDSISIIVNNKPIAKAQRKIKSGIIGQKLYIGSRQQLSFIEKKREYKSRVAYHPEMEPSFSATGHYDELEIENGDGKILLNVSFDGDLVDSKGVQGGRVRIGYRSALAFADLDGDGKMDLIVPGGNSNRAEGVYNLMFHRNIGGGSEMLFDKGMILVRDCGPRVSEKFYDWDGDGDLDLFFMKQFGALEYHENIGTKEKPVFEYRKILAKVNAHHEGGVAVGDWDGDGIDEVLVGNGDFQSVHLYSKAFLKEQACPYLRSMSNGGQTRNIADGPNMKTETWLKAIASASVANDQAAKMVDGDILDHSLWTGKGYPCWVRLDFEKPTEIDKVKIYSGNLAYAYYPSTEGGVKDFELQYLVDGEWKLLTPPVKNAPKFSGEDPEFGLTYKFAPVITESIRLYITDTNDPGTRSSSPKIPIVPFQKRSVRVREIKVYSTQ
jgi:VCBS repeat protein/F5/8 type C domain-containing protein/FG-GAP repeat protein